MDVGDARNWVFMVIAGFMVVTALWVVITSNVVHAALLLVATLPPRSTY